MPKERLQTKWNPDPESPTWEVFLSMKDYYSKRRTIDLGTLATHVKSTNNLINVDAIRAYLENAENFKSFNKVQERRDNNRYAVLKGEKQKPEIGFFLQVGASLLGASLATVVINAAVDVGYKNDQRDNNKALSYSDLLKQSISVLIVAFVVSAIGMGIAYCLSHKKHHEIMDAENEHKTINELLGRLDKIRDEVKLKNAVLTKFERFLRLNIAQDANGDKNCRDIIIAELDKNDNIETWRSLLNQNLHQLQSDDIDIIILKNKLINEYLPINANLASDISEIDGFPGLLAYIDNRMSANDINYGTQTLPKVFIAPYIAQLLQGKHLQLEDNHASSSNNNAHAFLNVQELPRDDGPQISQ